MPKNVGITIVPDWDSCTSVDMLENEFENWARVVSLKQFCMDKGISVTGNVDTLYNQEYKNSPKKFYVISSSTGNTAWYFGSNENLREQYKQQYHTLRSKKTNMRWTSFVQDTAAVGNQVKTSINGTYTYDKELRTELLKIAEDYKSGTISAQEKADRINLFNQKYGTEILADSTYSQIQKEAKKTTGGLVNDINSEISKTKESLEGNYILSEAARTELQKIATQYENGELTDLEKRKAVERFNETYNTNVSVKATAKSLKTAANKKNGILNVTGNDIAATAKTKLKEITNLSKYWDQSNNEVIKKFVDAGISGDVMWGIITGKYNKDDACRQDLEKLAALVAQGLGGSQIAVELRDHINLKYQLNLDESVTATDIANIVSTNQKYNYKKTVRKIAEHIIQEKLNEQIKKQIEEKIGCKLEDWGLEFKNGDIIGTIRNIIRGNTTAFFNEEKFLKKLQTELELNIDKLIKEKVNTVIDTQADKLKSTIDNVAGKIVSSIDPYRQKIDTLANKLDSWISNPESSKLLIAEKLDELIKSPVDSIASKLDKLSAPLQKLGLGNLGLGNMFKDITQKFTQGMAEKIYNITGPAVQKVLGIVQKVQAGVKKLIDTVNKLKEKAKQLVEQWKEKIKAVIKETAKKLVNELMKYVKIKFAGSISSSFKL